MTDNRHLWEYDEAQGDFESLCGIDEVGRGPLAGPVCAACVMLPAWLELPTLNDSKKMTEKRREAVFAILTEHPGVFYGIGFADQGEIDKINILQATFLAMNRAYAALLLKLPEGKPPRLALVDGNREPDFGEIPVRTIVKGDSLSANIAAASILAKVTRDRFMEEQDALYPQYGFAVHKGYGTRAHYDALREYGPCPIHRRTFLKKFYGN